MSKKDKLVARNNIITHWQENEYEKKMNDELSEISDLYMQLEFLNEFELKYKDDVQRTPYLAEASGTITAGNPHKAGFDAMIQNKREFINQQIIDKKIKPKGKRQQQVIRSLKFKNPETLDLLYNKLVGKFIDNSTTKEQFKATFTEQLKEATKPIKWIKDTKLLAYFLDKYFKHQNYQSIVESCKLFISKSDKPITASTLSSSLSQNNVKPRESEKLDKILESLINH